MNEKLSLVYNTLEKQRHHLIETIKNKPDNFNLVTSANRWTIHQILAHLVTAEKLSVGYLRKKIKGIDQVGNTGLLEEFKMVVLKISQRMPLKFKAPSPVIEATQAYSSLEELVADWNSTRESLRELLENIEDHQLKRKIYKHIIAGKLNILHAVIFLREHISHHLPQINRLLKEN